MTILEGESLSATISVPRLAGAGAAVVAAVIGIRLAIALSLPETLHGGPFTERSTLILLAAVVVVVTLIGGA